MFPACMSFCTVGSTCLRNNNWCYSTIFKSAAHVHPMIKKRLTMLVERYGTVCSFLWPKYLIKVQIKVLHLNRARNIPAADMKIVFLPNVLKTKKYYEKVLLKLHLVFTNSRNDSSFAGAMVTALNGVKFHNLWCALWIFHSVYFHFHLFSCFPAILMRFLQKC